MIFPNIKANKYDDILLDNLKEIAWDFDLDAPVIYNNDFVIVSGLDALKVWVYKTIRTTRFKYLIYGNAYGTSVKNLIGKVFNKDLERQLRKEIIDALLINKYIDKVNISKLNFDTNLNIELEITSKNQVLEVDISV